jgi:hypothetical protein
VEHVDEVGDVAPPKPFHKVSQGTPQHQGQSDARHPGPVRDANQEERDRHQGHDADHGQPYLLPRQAGPREQAEGHSRIAAVAQAQKPVDHGPILVQWDALPDEGLRPQVQAGHDGGKEEVRKPAAKCLHEGASLQREDGFSSETRQD